MKRFWDKVDRRGPDDCWEWTAGRAGGRGGEYGSFRLSRPRRQIYAHRFSFCLARAIDPASLPASIEIRHRCDNPRCVNPQHLEAGTHADNIRDMWKRKRQGQYGKLSIDQVRSIKKRLMLGDRVTDIARDFAVTHAAICHIKSGKTWKKA